MVSAGGKPHFVLIPFLGSFSHVIPMADLGCLLASHGAQVTFVTTPVNAAIVQSHVDDRAPASSPPITVAAVPFPGADAGLPEGCERMEMLGSQADLPRFFVAYRGFGEAVARYCLGLAGEAPRRRPSCVVSGLAQPWVTGLARQLGVPYYVFHGYGAFALLCLEHLFEHRPHEAVATADEPFDVPAMPPFRLRLSRRQLPPQFLPATSAGGNALQGIRDFDVAADGFVVNTFEELESGSTALLAEATGKKVVAVGSVSLCHAPSVDPGSMSGEARRCMAWLDAKEPKSVVYVSFGSIARMPPAQLMQLGMALVSCPSPVLWVIKGADSLPDDVKDWLRENTDMDGGKCMVVRGWAPQVAILAHPAVGGFVTHCGWGSILEAVAAGVPMATWPFFAEQFINEHLIVDVLAIGVSVGVTKPTENVLTASEAGTRAEAEVGMEQVKKALNMLMDQGPKGEERRNKVHELKLKAKGALKKGGSSYNNLENLIESFL